MRRRRRTQQHVEQPRPPSTEAVGLRVLGLGSPPSARPGGQNSTAGPVDSEGPPKRLRLGGSASGVGSREVRQHENAPFVTPRSCVCVRVRVRVHVCVCV